MKAVSEKHNISEATYYAWKRKYGGIDESEARRLRALGEENARPERLARSSYHRTSRHSVESRRVRKKVIELTKSIHSTATVA